MTCQTCDDEGRSDSGSPTPEVHKPFDDDGVTYCGWDGHEGCGEVWPCSTVRAADNGRSLLNNGRAITPPKSDQNGSTGADR